MPDDKPVTAAELRAAADALEDVVQANLPTAVRLRAGADAIEERDVLKSLVSDLVGKNAVTQKRVAELEATLKRLRCESPCVAWVPETLYDICGVALSEHAAVDHAHEHALWLRLVLHGESRT